MNNEPPYAYAVLSFWEQQPDRPVCMPRTGSRSGRQKTRGKAGDFSLRKQRKSDTPGHIRLLAENRASKQIAQLFRLAELAGYQIKFHLKKKKAA